MSTSQRPFIAVVGVCFRSRRRVCFRTWLFLGYAIHPFNHRNARSFIRCGCCWLTEWLAACECPWLTCLLVWLSVQFHSAECSNNERSSGPNIQIIGDDHGDAQWYALCGRDTHPTISQSPEQYCPRRDVSREGYIILLALPRLFHRRLLLFLLLSFPSPVNSGQDWDNFCMVSFDSLRTSSS